MAKERASEQVAALQCLRLFAAMAVVCLHAGADVWPRLLLGEGGVDIFFALSGFVMILSTQRLGTGPAAAKKFMSRRIIRIVPLYWVCVLVAFWMEMRTPGAGSSMKELFTSLFFVPYRGMQAPETRFLPVLGVGWTLNFEMFFYLCFAICLLLRKSPLWLTPVFLLLASYELIHKVHTFGPASLLSHRLLEFIFGMVMAKLYLRGWKIPLAVATPVLLGCLAAGAFLPGLKNGLGVVALSLTIFAMGLSFERLLHDRLPWVIEFLADASYSIYLVHQQFAVDIFNGHVAAAFRAEHEVLSFVAKVAAGVALGVLVHLLIERPILRTFKVRIGGHRMEKAVPA